MIPLPEPCPLHLPAVFENLSAACLPLKPLREALGSGYIAPDGTFCGMGGMDHAEFVATAYGLGRLDFRRVPADGVVAGFLKLGWIRVADRSSFEAWELSGGVTKRLEEVLDLLCGKGDVNVALDVAKHGVSYSFNTSQYVAEGYSLAGLVSRLPRLGHWNPPRPSDLDAMFLSGRGKAPQGAQMGP